MYDHQPTLPPDRFRAAAEHGLRVFPARARSKNPAIKWKRFQSEAPTAEDLINWEASDFNVCVVTGTPGGVLVLDVDSAEAQQVVDTLDLPPTATVRTARGKHLYFRMPAYEIGNSVNVAGVKLDVRATGGYVITAGSIHPDGSSYSWERSPAEVGFAPFPDQLLQLLETKKRSTRGGIMRAGSRIPATSLESGIGRYITHALDGAVTDLNLASEGERNDTLFKISARMARHVAAAEVDWSEVATVLGTAAINAGLEEGEIAATIESGWKRGSVEPTPWVRAAVEHVYLSAQNSFYHLASGMEFDKDGFNGQHGHNYHGKGKFVNFLLDHGYIRKVSDLTYDPLDPQRFIDRDGLHFLNTYRPPDVTAVAGDPEPFIDFMSNLVPDTEERAHLIKFIAFTVRNPGRKVRHALLLRTKVQGVGKSIMADIWGGLLGTHNVRKTTPREIFSDFQGYLRETLLVVCEEMNLGMGMKPYNEMKDVLTSDTAVINEKFKKPRVWPLHASMVFFSNLERPILVEQTDRRMFYIDSPAQKRDPDYYRAFSIWWRSNLGVIRAYLDSVDLDEFNPYAPPPMTAAKLGLIEGSKSELAKDLQWAIESRQGCFDRDLVTLDQVVFEMDRKFSPRKLADALKEVGAVSLGQQRIGKRKLSLWAIRNVGYWPYASNADRLEELESMEGGIFSSFDGIGIEVVHINSVLDAERLVAGFETEFGLRAPVV